MNYLQVYPYTRWPSPCRGGRVSEGSNVSSDKVTRAKRRANTDLVVARQVSIYKGANLASGCPSLVPGRFRKRKALNCGTPQCNMCGNPRHLWGHVTMAEQRSDIAMQQELGDL